MPYDHQNAKSQRIAKERLAKALKRVRESEADKKPFTIETQSLVTQSILPHLRKNSLKALHIYQSEDLGWHADLELRGMPPGVGRVLGTAVAMPCKTREEAEQFGEHLIATVLFIIENGSSSPLNPHLQDGQSTFVDFHGSSFALPIEMLQKLQVSGFKPDKAYAVSRLRDMEELYVVNGMFDAERWDAEDKEEQVRFLAVLAQAAVHGIFRWPPKEAPMVSRTLQ